MEFGAIFDGLEKEAETLFEKLDQRRDEPKSNNCNNQLIPKEVRNLIFEVNSKDGEPRSEQRKGRRRAIGNQRRLKLYHGM